MTWFKTSANRSISARVVYTFGVTRMSEKSLWLIATVTILCWANK